MLDHGSFTSCFVGVANSFILWEHSILPDGFRSMTGAESGYFRCVIKERLGRQQSGFFVPTKCVLRAL